jgi:hypothetical protein
MADDEEIKPPFAIDHWPSYDHRTDASSSAPA